MLDLNYIIEEGNLSERYIEKVCKNKIPYISLTRRSDDLILYSLDLSPVGCKLSDSGSEILRKFDRSEIRDRTFASFFIKKEDLTEFHKNMCVFVLNREFLEKDPNSKISFNFEKMSKLLADDTHWRYWKMLQDYANFRRDFQYYREAFKISQELYPFDRGSVLEVGSKNITTTLDMFSDDFQKYMLDKEFPPDFDPGSKITKIKGDLYTVDFGRKFDIVLCQQVLEHLMNQTQAFERLREFSQNVLVISVPYGSWHETQWDPIDEKRVFMWSKMKPDISSIVTDLGVERYVAGYSIGG